MSGAARGPGLTVSFQDFAADAEIVVDEDTIAPTALHRDLFRPDHPLTESFREGLVAIGPVTGGQAALIDAIEDVVDEPMAGEFAHLVAKTLVQLHRLDEPRGDLARKHWLQLIYLIRHGWNRPDHDLTAVVDGPAALLAQLDHAPSLAVRIDAEFVSEFSKDQRRRLLGYLRRLTSGVDVRIIGSRLAVRKLIEHHAADLPGDVTERARSALSRSSSSRPAEQVGQEAIESLGLSERQRTYWRLLTRVCHDIDGSVPQADLEDDLFLDVDSSTVRKYAARFEELGLVERPRRNGQVHLRPTAAGQAALSMAQEQAPHLVGGWSNGTHRADTGGTETASNADVNDPPNATSGPCTPNAHEWGEDGDRPTAEGSAAVRGGSSRPPPDCRYLGRHEHHAVAAAVPGTGGVALEEREIADITDERAVGWSLNEERNEVVVEAVCSPVQAFSAVRLCDALLNEKAEAQLLTPEKLNGGPGKFDLEGLDHGDNPYVLRKGRTLGWLRDQDAEGGRYLDRLRQARNELKQMAEECGESAEDGYYSPGKLEGLLRKAHGLQAVLVAIYQLLGYDVVRKLRVPDPAGVDSEDLAHFIKHQTSCSSRRGIYTAHRILYESRPQKRQDALGTPAISPDDYRGTVSGSWVVETPDTEPLKMALEDVDVGGLELQDGELNYQDIVVDVDVVDAHRRETISDLAQRLLPEKNLRSDRELLSLLHALVGSPTAAGAALNGMGAADQVRRLDHGDLEFGLYSLVATDADGNPYHDRYGAADLVPDIGGPTVGQVLGALLKQEESLSTSEVADAADVSTQSIRNNREPLEQLEVLGFISIEEGGPGCADSWSFHLPGVEESEISTFADERPPIEHVFGRGWGGEDWRIDEAIHELLLRLTEAGHDLPVSPGDEFVLETLSGPPQQRQPARFIRMVPELRPLLQSLARLVETELPTSMLNHGFRLGKPPKAAVQQATLATDNPRC